MKHIWVVESSGGKKWNPQSTFWTKIAAEWHMGRFAKQSPGLRWRVAKYVREAK
jgi:hypothetical protein